MRKKTLLFYFYVLHFLNTLRREAALLKWLPSLHLNWMSDSENRKPNRKSHMLKNILPYNNRGKKNLTSVSVVATVSSFEPYDLLIARNISLSLMTEHKTYGAASNNANVFHSLKKLFHFHLLFLPCLPVAPAVHEVQQLPERNTSALYISAITKYTFSLW